MAPPRKIEKDIAEYRDMMATPEEYRDGFTLRTILGVFFIAVVMMPSAIYLGLMAGQHMGPAAVWVTIILFADVARRSFKPLHRQELYLLFYAAGTLVAMIGGVAMAGGPFAQLIWRQYLRTSAAAESFGVASEIPTWVVPTADSDAIVHRTFLHRDWALPVLVLVISGIIGRVQSFTGGYVLFRAASDVEKLPFPMAPIAAQGATALAESGKETWRWRTFSIGAMIGIAFGLIYVFIPAFTGAVFDAPIQIIPIPWMDFTLQTESILPAATVGISTNLGSVILGMVLPFWTVVGRFAAGLTLMFGNTFLYRIGVLTSWRRGTETIMTEFMNMMDFWLSFGIGTGAAIAFVGFYITIKSSMGRAKNIEDRDRGAWTDVPKGRGDFSIGIAVGLFFLCTAGLIAMCMLLLGRQFRLVVLFFAFGFLYTPIMSYVNARLLGLAGQVVGFPMLRQAMFIFSGYQGVDIWFAPFPMQDFGRQAQRFREIELTGTSFRSVIKLELLMFPVLWAASFIFWGYIWQSGPRIPSEDYPYAQRMWHRRALSTCLWYSATLPEEGAQDNLLYRAIRWDYIGYGLGFGAIAYFIMSAAGLPTLALYGYISGIGILPHMVFPEIFGAILGRYYFAPKFGRKLWLRATPVLMAGFSCGMGLIGMIGAAIALLAGAVQATGA